MHTIASVFWNRDEHRFRSLWRLIGQLIILIVVALPLQMGVGAAAVGVLMFQAGTTLGQLTDPEVMQRVLAPQALQELLFGSPVLVVLSALEIVAVPGTLCHMIVARVGPRGVGMGRAGTAGQ